MHPSQQAPSDLLALIESKKALLAVHELILKATSQTLAEADAEVEALSDELRRLETRSEDELDEDE